MRVQLNLSLLNFFFYFFKFQITFLLCIIRVLSTSSSSSIAVFLVLSLAFTASSWSAMVVKSELSLLDVSHKLSFIYIKFRALSFFGEFLSTIIRFISLVFTASRWSVMVVKSEMFPTSFHSHYEFLSPQRWYLGHVSFVQPQYLGPAGYF